MPTYRQSSQNAGQVAKPRSLYDSVEQRRSPPISFCGAVI